MDWHGIYHNLVVHELFTTSAYRDDKMVCKSCRGKEAMQLIDTVNVRPNETSL